MSGPRLKDMPIGALRRMARAPMTPWEERDTDLVAAKRGGNFRGNLRGNERWLRIAYVNNRYHVQVSVVQTTACEMLHLWIGRTDREMPRSWSDLQRIKNEIVGPERVAVEVFPPVSELVDQAPLAHLWVYPEGHVLPFTL